MNTRTYREAFFSRPNTTLNSGQPSAPEPHDDLRFNDSPPILQRIPDAAHANEIQPIPNLTLLSPKPIPETQKLHNASQDKGGRVAGPMPQAQNRPSCLENEPSNATMIALGPLTRVEAAKLTKLKKQAKTRQLGQEEIDEVASLEKKRNEYYDGILKKIEESGLLSSRW